MMHDPIKNVLGMKLPSRELLPKVLVSAFFIFFLWVGLYIHNDFGLQIDSVSSFNRGQMIYDYIMNFDATQAARLDTHGWVFDAVVRFIQMGLNLSDTSVLFQTKYLMTFILFFISVIFFYRLCRDHFESWILGLAGSLFLVLSPRIFAHSFYNPKDSPCLDLFIMSIYTLTGYLGKKTYSRAAVHALICSLLVAVRNLGILVPVMTGFFVMMDLIFVREEKAQWRRVLGSLVLFSVLSIALVILFWPILWSHPIDQFIHGFNEMKRYEHNARMIYIGEYICAYQVPWHYIPVWVVISTPLVYIALFCFGVWEAMRSLFRRDLAYSFKRNTLIVLIWFFAPVGAIILFHSVVYNAWRQMTFIYPGFLVLVLGGIGFINRVISHVFCEARARIPRFFLTAAIVLCLVPVSVFMIRSHPVQDVYFNELVGGVSGAKYSFDVDYWGVSYRKALEYILAHDSGKKVKVCAQQLTFMKNNSLILDPLERARLEFTDFNDAQYYISNFIRNEGCPYKKEIYSLRVDQTKIVAVYKLR